MPAAGWQKDGRGHAAAAGVLNTQVVQLLDDIRSGASYRFFLFQRNGLLIDFQNPTAPSASPRVTGNTGDAMADPLLKRGAIRRGGNRAISTCRLDSSMPACGFYGLVHGLQGSRQQTGIGVIASEADLLRHLPLNRFFFRSGGFGIALVSVAGSGVAQ